MKQTIAIIALMWIVALSARAENIPLWDSIVVTTGDAGQLVTIHAIRGEGRLTNLVVTVGTNSLCVPQAELKDTPDPQLDTLRFG